MSAFDVLKSQVISELKELRRLLEEAALVEKKKQSKINIRAGASILHDFYTGAERIFQMIASNIDERVPSGMSWHTELLNQKTLNILGLRSAIISRETAKMLYEYLRFKHLFRKRYGFELEWIDIKRLLKKMPEVYTALEKDINKAFEGE